MNTHNTLKHRNIVRCQRSYDIEQHYCVPAQRNGYQTIDGYLQLLWSVCFSIHSTCGFRASSTINFSCSIKRWACPCHSWILAGHSLRLLVNTSALSLLVTATRTMAKPSQKQQADAGSRMIAPSNCVQVTLQVRRESTYRVHYAKILGT